MKISPKLFSVAILTICSLALAACNGSGSGTAPSAYTIGGTVINLAGTAGGLVLQNSKETLPVSANGSFTFSTSVTSGTSYSVTISAQPSNPGQTCSVTNGSGVATANVTNIQINCAHNEWSWVKGPNTISKSGVYGTQGIAATSNNPGGRQLPITWTDSSGNFWIFGGYGFDSAGTLLPMNDVWKYSASQWTWIGGSDLGGQEGTYGTRGVPAPKNTPGARSESSSWTDSSGALWLFGGNGYDSVGNEASLNDLWKFSSGEWSWMSGSRVATQQGVYGTLHVPAPGNTPGSRFGAVSWTDSSGNFWLFGGLGYDSNGSQGALNDLWKYNNGEWSWGSGSKVVNQLGIYGNQGVPAPGNVPGSRNWSVGWTDSSGDLWLFGGVGYAITGPDGCLNDLWRFSNGQWTWMSGSPLTNQVGVYGARGVAAAGNVPGWRQMAVSWTDPSGNFWLFGGNGPD
jgi:N-acetylneuraminic acid mutarotase